MDESLAGGEYEEDGHNIAVDELGCLHDDKCRNFIPCQN
jgi:hypothetical protein